MPCRPSSPICGHSCRGEFVGLVDLGGDRRDLVGGEALRRLADRVGHLAKIEVEGGLAHACLLGRRASTGRARFEQAGATGLCALQHCLSRSIIMATTACRPDRHPVLRPHADGRDAGRACRRLGDRPRRDRGQGGGRAGRASAATTSTASTWAACFPPGSARRRRARRRSRPACPSRSRRPPSTRSADRACRR